MSPKFTEKEWLEDFREFVETKGEKVSDDLSQRILARVRKDLNPSSLLVFSKLLGVHAVVGTLSLAVCDQFGVRPFNWNFSLAEYFMKFGHSACMVFCGFLFLGLTSFFAWHFLKPEEFLVLKKNVVIQVFFLSVLSAVAFLAFGAQLMMSALLFWMFGALLGGFATVKALSLRTRFA